MNSSPRLTCRLVRLWLEICTGPEGNAGFCARHAGTCGNCQRYFETSRELQSALGQAARRAQISVPAGLEGDILRALDRAGSHPPRRRPSPRAFFLPSVAGAACLALVFFSLRPAPTPPSAPLPEPVQTYAAAETPGEPAAVSVWSRLQPSTDALLDAAPLQEEVAAVYADARSAIGFLALNFFPAASPSPGLKSNPVP